MRLAISGCQLEDAFERSTCVYPSLLAREGPAQDVIRCRITMHERNRLIRHNNPFVPVPRIHQYVGQIPLEHAVRRGEFGSEPELSDGIAQTAAQRERHRGKQRRLRRREGRVG